MVFRTRTTAACSLWRFIAEGLGGIEPHGILVAGLIVCRIERTHHLIEQDAFVIIHVAGIIGVIAVEVASELQQVVCAACLVDVWVALCLAFLHPVGGHTDNLGIGLTEHLPVAHTACCIGITSLNQGPEVTCNVIIVRIAIDAIAAQSRYDHRDVLIGMTSADVIDVAGEIAKELGRIETV